MLRSKASNESGSAPCLPRANLRASMPAQQQYITSILQSFSTFLAVRNIQNRSAEDAMLVLVEYLKQTSASPTWTPEEVTQYINSLSQVSRDAKNLVHEFLIAHPPHQTNVFLNDFLLALLHDNCSASTIKNYRSDIGQFIHFCQISDLRTLLQKPNVLAFLKNEADKGLKSSSLKRKLASITQFALWAEEHELSKTISPWLTEISADIDKLLINQTIQPQHKPEHSSFKHWAFPVESHAEKLKETIWRNPFAASRTSGTAQDSQELRTKLKAGLASITQSLQIRTQAWMLPYLNLAMIVLFFLGAAYFGYLQFFRDAPEPLAYPSSLTRPNRTLSFQGRLTDTAQNPITTPTDLRFRLYDSGPSTVGGTELWDSGTCSITPDQDGIFATGLGDDCGTEITNDVFTENSNVWLQVEVETEVLDPRQQIKTVAYALNSETLQGFPASISATESTVVVMDEFGNVTFGSASPILQATGNSFAIEANSLELRTTPGSNGDITLNPDGTGDINLLADINLSGYLYAPGATLSATYAGGTALVTRGGPSGTANIQEWQNNAGTALSVVDELGNIGIGTSNPSSSLDAYTGSVNSSTYRLGGTNRLYNSGGNDTYLTANSSANVLINSSGGNVGIGNNNPNSQLHIDSDNLDTTIKVETNWVVGRTGQLLFTSQGVGYMAGVQSRTPGGSQRTLDFVTSGDSNSIKMSILGDGNVGIGTTDPLNNLHILDSAAGSIIPQLKLHVVSSANDGSEGSSIDFVASSDPTAVGSRIVAVRKLSGAHTDLRFHTGRDSERVRIDEIGNVGIGVTNPTSFLDIAAASAAKASVRVRTGSAPSSPNEGDIYADGTDIFYYDGSTWVDLTLGGTGTGWWDNTLNVLHPKNEFAGVVDLVVGGTSTASADFRVTGLGNGSTDLAGYTYARRFIDIDSTSYYVEPGNTTTAGVFAGNVGIGTASPTYKLDINGTSNTVGVRVASSTANDILYYGTGTVTGDISLLSSGISATGSVQMDVLNTNSTSSTANSLLRLATTGANSGDPLINFSITGQQDWAIGVDNSDSDKFKIGYSSNFNTNNVFTADTAGNVGIGTIAPDYKFHVEINENASIPATVMQLSNAFSGQDVDWRFKLNSSKDLRIESTSGNSDFSISPSTAAPNAFYITNTGNVGIGTTAPSYKLDVNGTSRFTDWVNIANNKGLQLLGDAYIKRNLNILAVGSNDTYLGTNTVSGNIYFKTGDAVTGTERMRITSTGNVGIGTTIPSYKLQVSGALGIDGGYGTVGTSPNKLVFGSPSGSGGTPNAGSLAFGDNTGWKYHIGTNVSSTFTPRVTFMDTGNVGIGTTAPNAKLQVSGGNIRLNYGNTSQAYLFSSGNYGFLDYFDASNNGVRLSALGPLRFGSNTDANYGSSTFTEAMRITGGNVGIGTSTPSTFKLEVAGDVGPTADSTYSLGSSGRAWLDIYGDNLYQNGNEVCDISGNCPNGAWFENTANVLHPRNEYASIADLVIGGNSTASADFQVIGSGANAGYVYGRRFLDIDDTNYYVEPGSTTTAGLFAGNVGIGTTSTNASLEVSRSDDSPILRLQRSTQPAYWDFRVSNGAYNVSDLRISPNSDTSSISFENAARTAATLHMRPDTLQVGINDTSPDFRLESTGSSGSGYFGITNSTDGDIFMISSTGNVGVGTTSPQEKLQVDGVTISGDTTATQGSLAFGIRYTGNDILNTFGSAFSSADTVIGSAVKPKSGSAGYVSSADNAAFTRGALRIGDDLEFLNAGSSTTPVGDDVSLTSRFMIAASGYVGIGTNNPATALDVAGGDITLQNDELISNSTDDVISLTGAGGADNTDLGIDLDGIYPRLFSTTDDKIGIEEGLEFVGAQSITTSTGNLTIAPDAGSDLLVNLSTTGDFVVNTDDFFVDTSAGFVGIGSTSPATSLDVVGNINATTGYYYGGTSSPLSLELTRTLPTTVNDYVEIGNINVSNGAHNVRLSITVPSGANSVAKSYIIPIKYGQTSGAWQLLSPLASTGPYSGQDFEVDVSVSTNTASFRIRRSAGTTAGTAYVRVESTGYTADAFTATTGTGTTTAPTAVFSSTPLAAVEGNVGIGTTAPTSLLSVGLSEQFKVGSDGDIDAIKNLAYSWPAAHSASAVLVNDGSGNLTWSTVGATGVTADSLDFTEFQDDMDLDATTNVDFANFDYIFDLDGTGDFKIQDAGVDHHIFYDNGDVRLGNNNELYVDTDTGFVGIGTTSPGTPFHVYHPTINGIATFESGDADVSITLKDSNSGTGGVIGVTNNDLYLLGGGVEGLRIKSGGNVGIGTTTVPRLLTINGAMRLNTTTTPGSPAAGDIYSDGTNLYYYNGTGWDDLTASGTNYWGLTANALHPANEYAGVVDVLVGGSSTASANVRLASNGDGYFAGNVGVGTTITSEKLTVNGGNIRINQDSADRYLSFGSTVKIQSSNSGGNFDFAGGSNTTATYRFWNNNFANILASLDATGMYLGGPSTATNRLDVNGGIAVGSYAGTSAPTNGMIVSGNVGIGTTIPSQKLDVFGEIELSNYLYFGNGTTEYIRWDSSDFLVSDDILPIANDAQDLGSSASRWRDLYLGAETLHIGTSLTDEGTISYDTTGNIFNFGTDATTNGDIAFFTDDLYLDKSSGNIGIGTTAPGISAGTGVHVTLSEDSWSTANRPTLEFDNPSDSITDGGRLAQISIYAGTAHNEVAGIYSDAVGTSENAGRLEFWTATGGSLSERMRITEDGNVGIGSTSPSQLLDVSKSQNAETWATVQNATNDTSATAGFSARNGSKGVSLTYRAAAYTIDPAWADAGGLRTDTSVTGGLILSAGGTNSVKFETNDAERMRIDSAGNVGIGTTTPTSFKLEIAGNIGPTTDSTYDLGSGSKAWANIYADNLYQNGNVVCDDSGNCPNINWFQNTANVLHPKNEYASVVDLVLGGTSTASADIRLGSDGTGYFAGNVGIGTTAPSALLDVTNNQNADTRMQVFNSNAGTAARSIVSLYNGTNEGGHVLVAGTAYTGVASWQDSMVLSTDSGLSGGLKLRSATGGIKLSASATEANDFFVAGTGNVGLGTTAPTTRLQSSYTTNGFEQWRVDNLSTGTSAAAAIAMGNSTGGALSLGKLGASATDWSGYGSAADTFIYSSSTGGGDLNIINSFATGDINFYAGSSATGSMDMVIKSTGNVGIGTSTVTSGYTLDVAGNQYLQGDLILDNNSVALYNTNNIATGPDIKIFSNGVFATEGNLYLNIDSDNGSADSLFIGHGAETSAATTIMTIRDTGNVGIGTTTTDQRLSISGNINMNDGIIYNRTTAGNVYGIGMAAFGGTELAITSDNVIDFTESDSNTIMAHWELNSGIFAFDSYIRAYDASGLYLQDDAGNNGIYILDGGNVSIGTTYNETEMYVQSGANTSGIEWVMALKNPGNALVTGYGTGLQLKQGQTTEHNKWSGIAAVADSTYANTSGLAFYANESEEMRINGGGNIGMGTTSAAASLHIYRPDADYASLALTGGNQGTGMVFVGQSMTHGGGMTYNGDGTPATVGTTDNLSFFVRNASTDTEVLRFPYNSTTGYFAGTIDVANDIYFDTNNNYISYPDGDYGSLMVGGDGKGTWEGFSINGRYVFMSDDNNHVGLYNDVNNRWILSMENASYTRFMEPDSTAEAMRIAANGSLNIGTTAGSGLLNVQGSGYFANDGAGTVTRINVTNNNATANSQAEVQIDWATNYWALFGKVGNSGLQFWDGNDTQVRFDADASGKNDNGWATAAVDFAEYYEKVSYAEHIEAGDVVAIKNGKVTKDLSGEHAFVSVISTAPGFAGGVDIYEDGSLSQDMLPEKYQPVAKVGQVPIKVTTEAGNITEGDAITHGSAYSGFGVQAETVDYVIGRAMENFPYASCTPVNSVNEITWVADDPFNKVKECYVLPNGTKVGKIMMYVNMTWYDPVAEINNQGMLSLTQAFEQYDATLQSLQSAIAANTASITGLNDTTTGLIAQVGSASAHITNLTNRITTIEAQATQSASVKRLGVGVAAPASDSGKLIDTSAGAFLSDGGVWTNVSDATKKENFTTVDADTILDKISALPITQWNYIAEDDTVTHIGPTAQDFHAAFGLGKNNTTISTIDPAGVALAGIQALAKDVKQTHFDDAGQLIIQENEYGEFEVATTKKGTILDSVLGAADAVFGSLRAGSAKITKLSVDTLEVGGASFRDAVRNVVREELATQNNEPSNTAEKLLALSASPKPSVTPNPTPASIPTEPAVLPSELELIDGADDDSTALSVVGNVSIQGELTTATLSAQEASIAGVSTEKLDAASARITALEAGMAQLQHIKAQTAEFTTATISGTLYADSIDKLEERIEATLKKPSLIDALLNKQTTTVPEADPQVVEMVVEHAGYEVDAEIVPPEGADTLEELNSEEPDAELTSARLFVEEYFELNGTGFVAQSLGIGDSLFVGNGMEISEGHIAYAPEGIERPELQIQSSGVGSVNFLAGVMVIEDSGKVGIQGDLTVSGAIAAAQVKTNTLLTNLIQPTEFGTPFQVQVAGISTSSGELKKSRFEIINESGEAVAAFDADGNAEFSGGIKVSDISVAQESLADQEPQDDTVTTSKSSGTAVLKANKDKIIIKTDKVKGQSLVYVTPKSSTENKVLYIKSQQDGQFEVGFDGSIGKDVEFNWWIVN